MSSSPPADFERLLSALVRHAVDFVVIGGLALTAHGGSRVTLDVDLMYQRGDENLQRLATALATLRPRLRGIPEELPFVLDAASLASGLNFTLSTDAGDLDIFGEVPGLASYAEVAANALRVELYGGVVRILSLADLESSKRAAGRAKDLMDLGEIEALKRRLPAARD